MIDSNLWKPLWLVCHNCSNLCQSSDWSVAKVQIWGEEYLINQSFATELSNCDRPIRVVSRDLSQSCQWLTTQSEIEFTYASHCVSTNLTPRRMLKKSLLIARINRWNSSFQNMYDVLYCQVSKSVPNRQYLLLLVELRQVGIFG